MVPGGRPDPNDEQSRQRQPAFSYAVGRASGTVVVTTHGPLGDDGVGALADVLTDLIADQGNLAVVVDVRDLRLEGAEDLTLLGAAARSADGQGGTLLFADPCDRLAAALRAAGLGDQTVCSGGASGDGHVADLRERRTRLRHGRGLEGIPPAAGEGGPRDRGA